MKITAKLLKENANTPLQKNVVNWAIEHKESDYSFEQIFKDLFYGGCASGMVGHLIYYTDTIKFYKKHKAEINDLLKDSMFNYGSNSPVDLFGDRWDKDDPLCQDETNQNLLAWFGFEESARIICDYVGIEI